MPITVMCSCGKKLSIGERLAGKRVKCPQCQKAVSVPAAASTPGSRATAKTGSGNHSASRLVNCARCNGKVAPEALVKLRGQLICKPCKEEALMERPSTEEKNRKVLLWSGIAGGIGLLVVVGLGIFLAVRMANKPGAKPKEATPAADFASSEAKQPAAPASQPLVLTADAAKTPAKPGGMPVKSRPDPALANLRELRHEPKAGERWRFRLDITLAPPDSKDAMEGNRITGDLELTQKDRSSDQHVLELVFNKLDVAKPFTDDDHRGAEAFPKNVLGKKMTLLLGPKKGAEKPPESWPAGLPFIANAGDEIKHDDDTKDPAGLAFKKYLTPHANDLLAQAFLFLGRDMLPKELGKPASWDIKWPYLMEANAYGPISYACSRQAGLANHIAAIDIKSKSEHDHKAEDGKVKARLKVTGTGNWKYNLDDSMTDSLHYNARIEEEAVENQTRNAYLLRLTLTRQKIDPREVAAADKAANPPAEEMPKKPDEPKKPAAPAGAPPPVAVVDAKPTDKDAKPDRKEPPTTPADKPKPDAAPGKEPAKPDAGDKAEDKEKLAQAKLKQAKQFIELDKNDDAIDYCEQIIKRWPGTKAAEEAQTLLKKLKK